MEKEQKAELNIRDIALRDNFTASEKLHFIGLLSIFLMITWNANNQSLWTSSLIFIIGFISIINLRLHQLVHPFYIDKLWSKYFYYNVPFLALSIIYILGASNTCLEIVNIDNLEHISFNKPDTLIVNIMFNETWLFFLGLIFALSLTTHILIIPKSLYFITKFLFWCCISSLILAIVGFIYKASNLTKPLFAAGTNQNDFFSYFSYDRDWAIFALLWMFVSFLIAQIEFEKNDQKFLKSNTALMLSTCLLLASTSVVINPSIASMLLTLSFAYLCNECILKFRNTDPIFKQICPFINILKYSSIAYSIYIFNNINFSDKTNFYLKESGINMISDNIFFGWGKNSFEELAPFYNNNVLLESSFKTIPSTYLNIILEYGIVGFLIISLYILILFLRYFFKKQTNYFSEKIFLSLFILFLYSFFENPFYNISVLYSFLIIAYFAFRWSELIHNRADVVDTKTHLIADKSLRKVPFVTNPKKEVFK